VNQQCGAHIHAPGGPGDDEDFGCQPDLAADDEFLQVAARQPLGDVELAAGINVEGRNRFARRGPGRPQLYDAVPHHAGAPAGEQRIVGER
jgi:hypothetical protein